MAKYNFSNTKFVREHGKNPYGVGLWGFMFRGDFRKQFPEAMYSSGYTAIMLDEPCKLSEAKETISQILRDNEIPLSLTIYVAP